VTRGVLPARRISCFLYYESDCGNWTAKGIVFRFLAMKACSGRRGVAPLILILDNKRKRKNLIMRVKGWHKCCKWAGFASSPFYSSYGFLSRRSVQSVPAHCCRSVQSVPAHCCMSVQSVPAHSCPIAGLLLSVMTSA
jgi:hypothetical protein